MVYHASDPVLLLSALLVRTLVYFGPYHSAFAYYFDIAICADDLARQNDVELDLRPDLRKGLRPHHDHDGRAARDHADEAGRIHQ